MIAVTLASRSQLARELGISPGTFARYERDGLLPRPLKGTRRYVREEVLRSLLPKSVAPALARSPAEIAYAEWKRSRDQG